MFTKFVQLVQEYKQIPVRHLIDKFGKKKAYKTLKRIAINYAENIPIDTGIMEDFANAYLSTAWMLSYKELSISLIDSFKSYNTIEISTDNLKYEIFCNDSYFNVSVLDSNNKHKYSHESLTKRMYRHDEYEDEERLSAVEEVIRTIFKKYMLDLLEA